MINLAGDKNCDDVIKKELSEAGIALVHVGEMKREVPASIIGKCNNFIFSRNWYYWVVTGYMPLESAKEIYEKYKHLCIRAAGHCGNPPPEEWSEPKNRQEICQPFVDAFFRKEMTTDECNSKCNELLKKEEQFIVYYHIDTQEGLNRFVEFVKQNNIIG